MANAIEIKNRIKSINDTMKITKAMYMISSNKLQKAKSNRLATEPFFYGVQAQISRLLRHFPDIRHIYFDNREKDMQEVVKKKGFLVVTADKGLAGAYNHNVLKTAEKLIKEAEDPYVYVIGQLGYHFFLGKDIPLKEEFLYTAQNPTMHRARVISDRIIQDYLEEKLDAVYMVYTRMANAMEEEVVVEQLLPLKRQGYTGELNPELIMKDSVQEEFEFLPSPEVLLEHIVPSGITGYIYGALIESYSCEQNARMTAMKAATDNATKMLHDLSIQYNRVRQASITQEINEVVGGAKALKRKKTQK